MKQPLQVILLFLVSYLCNLATGAFTCTKQGETGCDDCGTLVVCQGTSIPFKKLAFKCQSTQVCNNSTSAGCYSLSAPEATNCKCKLWPKYISDPYDPSHYIMCSSSTAQFSLKCTDGKIFNATKGTCVLPVAMPPTPPPPTCTEIGFFTNDPTCKTYYACMPDASDHLTPTAITPCDPPEYFFDATKSECVKDLLPETFECPDIDGGIMDTVECNKFHICSNGTELGDPICCASGELFDSASMTCLPAAQVDQSKCPQISTCIDSKTIPRNCSDLLLTTTLSSMSPSSLSSSSLTSSSLSSSRSSSTSTTKSGGLTPTCAKDGAVAYPGDCTKYFFCASGKYTLQYCPAKLLFNPTRGFCDSPSNVSGC